MGENLTVKSSVKIVNKILSTAVYYLSYSLDKILMYINSSRLIYMT